MEHAELPLDIKLMTVATRALVVLLGVLVAATLALWALRHPVWTVRAITVQGDVVHQNAVTFRAQLASQMKNSLSGSFLTLDLQQVRQLFEAVPWVRRAVVQRDFPNRLKVTIEEHRAVAWWGEAGSGRLVNALGEVFEASPDEGEELPELAGPDQEAAQVWSLFRSLQTEFGRLEMGVARLQLNERGSWSADLDSGARIELGRGTPEELLARVQRFTGTLSQLTARYPGAIQSVDLRYPNGYALRVRGVTTVTEDSPEANPNTR